MPDSVPEEALGPVRSVTGGAGVEGGPAIVSARPRRRAPRRPVCGRRCDGWDRLATRGRLGGPGSRCPRAPRTSRGDRGRRCGAAVCPRRGYARRSAPTRPTRRASPAAGSRGRSRCRTPAFARLSREAGRKQEGILRSTGLGVPDARA